MKTGERIIQLRKAHGIQRKELAAKLGVTASTLWRWEMGDRAIREDKLREIAFYLKVPVTELLGEVAVIKDENTDFAKAEMKNAVFQDWYVLPVYRNYVNLQLRLKNLDSDERIALPLNFVGFVSDVADKKPFAVQVEGDSMAMARICSSSLAVVNPAEEVLDGDAALIKYGARYMIRWLYWRDGKGCELRAASEKFPALRLDFSQLHDGVSQVLGKVMWTFSKPQVGL